MDKKGKVALGVGLGAATALGIWALTREGKAQPPPPPPPPPGLATVRITVVSTRGQAIAGASVSLDSSQGSTSSVGIIDFTSVEPSSYSLSVSAAGYQPKSQAVTVLEGTNSFRVELVRLAPAIVTIHLGLTNYPSDSFAYDASLLDGTFGENIRISQQVILSGPAQTTLLVKIYDEAGATIYLEQVEVTLEDGQYYLFDCGTKQLVKREIPWKVLAINIPAQAPYAGEFMPSGRLKLAAVNNYAYAFGCSIGYSGQPIRFLSWSFFPVGMSELSKVPGASRPLDAPDDIYDIEGCNLGKEDATWRSGPCTLYYRDRVVGSKTYNDVLPVPPGRYTVHAGISWAPLVYDPSEGDVHTIEPRSSADLGDVAVIDIVIEDNFVLQNLQVPAYAYEGELVTTSVDVVNIGVAPGEAELTYRDSISDERAQTISLSPGERRTITYQFTVPSPYRYTTVRVTFEIERFAQKLQGKIKVLD